jgi:hypothetical protein
LTRHGALALVLSLAALVSPAAVRAATEAAHTGNYYRATSTAIGGGGAFEPRSSRRHSLRVKLYLSWTWRYGTTRLDSVRMGSFPRRTHVIFQCTGRGCQRRAKAAATGPRGVRRLLRTMAGRRYRVGEVLTISLTAPGYRPEQAAVTFRYGRRPKAKLLSR